MSVARSSRGLRPDRPDPVRNLLDALNLDGLAPVDLEDLDRIASLQVRTDRKYVITSAQLHSLRTHLGDGARVLEIDGRRTFLYESMYFDTAGFDLFRASAKFRPNRVKVRTRTYVEPGRCVLEVKRRDRRGVTSKHRIEHDAVHPTQLTDVSVGFLESFTELHHLAAHLQPVLTARFRRSTLLMPDGSRVTLDTSLTSTDQGGRVVGIQDALVLETKVGSAAASLLDHLLWKTGMRPATISKYCTSLAALNPQLPSNKWQRTIDRHFTLLPFDPP